MNTDILLARQAARRRAEAKRAVPNSAPSVAFVTHNLDEEVGKTVHEKGYLVKQGEKVKSWKKRYFVLTGTMLRWCVASSNRSPRRPARERRSPPQVRGREGVQRGEAEGRDRVRRDEVRCRREPGPRALVSPPRSPAHHLSGCSAHLSVACAGNQVTTLFGALSRDVVVR